MTDIWQIISVILAGIIATAIGTVISTQVRGGRIKSVAFAFYRLICKFLSKCHNGWSLIFQPWTDLKRHRIRREVDKGITNRILDKQSAASTDAIATYAHIRTLCFIIEDMVRDGLDGHSKLSQEQRNMLTALERCRFKVSMRILQMQDKDS